MMREFNTNASCGSHPNCPPVMQCSACRDADQAMDSRCVRRRRVLSAKGGVQRIGQRVLVLLIAALWPFAVHVQELIANQGVSVQSLSQNEARLFFSMRLQRWPDDRPIKVFVLPDDHPLHASFSKNLLGLFPYQLRGVWDRQLFSGTGQAPTTVADEDEMIRRVASTPGAIGYVRNIPQSSRVTRLEVH